MAKIISIEKPVKYHQATDSLEFLPMSPSETLPSELLVEELGIITGSEVINLSTKILGENRDDLLITKASLSMMGDGAEGFVTEKRLVD